MSPGSHSIEVPNHDFGSSKYYCANDVEGEIIASKGGGGGARNEERDRGEKNMKKRNEGKETVG